MIRTGDSVAGTFIDALSWDGAIATIAGWAAARESRYVALCNVHSVVTASRRPDLAAALDHADLALPDGMPIAWQLRASGFAKQARLSGPDLMWRYCEHAARDGSSIFLYGSAAATLAALERNLRSSFPGLQIAGSYAPPMMAEGALEEPDVLERINRSGASVIFVGLGCPKQELWMMSHRPHLRAVLVGVGAAFDYHAGTIARAPRWVQRLGLEWAARLLSEPRRLWRRYLATNSVFLLLSLRGRVARRALPTREVRELARLPRDAA